MEHGEIKMNFTQLKTNIQNFIEDDSTELDTSIPEIIKQAESMIFLQDCLICLVTGKQILVIFLLGQQQ